MTESEAKKKVVALARSQIGTHEGPDNQNPYADDPMITRLYGWNVQNQPWCGTFVNWLFLTAFGYEVGSRMTYGGSAACANQANLYRKAGAFFQNPELGDQVFFYSGGSINHTGIVIDVSAGAIRTVEGNYSDKVSECTYALGASVIAGYGRPNWSLAADVPGTGSTNDIPDADDTLRYGSRGDAVKTLQEKLIDLGYSCGPDGADGIYGYNTIRAIQAFQMDHNLPISQNADKALQDKIMAANQSADPPSENQTEEQPAEEHSLSLTTLKSGSKGMAVIFLQADLNLRGFDCGAADGIFGAKTQAAVNRARQFFGMEATGECDDELWTKLLIK